MNATGANDPTGRQLLIVAHGSRRRESNDEVRYLGERVAELGGQDLDTVAVAFLELAEPSIPEGLESCVARGAREILVLPYFLAAGTHVARDIPLILEQFRVSHPEVEVRLASHLGASAALARTILDAATKPEVLQ